MPTQISDNIAPRVKRYTDIEKGKGWVNAVRVVAIVLSIALGAAVIVLIVHFTTKKTSPSPPTSPQVDDKDYAGYLRSADKVLPVWSNTFSSKSANSDKPAYLAMLTNQSQINIIKKFIEKHNYSEIMVYTGCVEWTADEWQHKSFPYWSQVESFLKNFDGTRLGAMIYLNDKKDNITEYSLLKTFAGAYVNYN